MNKQDKTLGKALDIALSLGSNKPTLDRCVETGIQMAAWKEQQMIEKAVLYLTENRERHRFLWSDIEDFKKYMEEN